MSATPYHPPSHLLQVLQRIEYEQALQLGDPRYVDTREARGSQRTLSRLAKKFGLDLKTDVLYAPEAKHVLFFGHTGSGKTTELRHYARELSGPNRFFIVEVDVVQVLDPNNLQYADTLMALAQALLLRLNEESIHLGQDSIGEIEKWFSERVLEAEEGKEFSAQLEAGAKAKGGIPFLVDLFAKFTASIKANASYKDKLRRVVRNNFTQLKDAFNGFVRKAEETLQAAGKAQRILFVIDGTDKMRGEDTQKFFIEDAEQLLAITAFVIYTAPLSLKSGGNLAGKLDADLVLPMIKLQERDGSPCAAGARAMSEILLRRADRKLFASEAEIDLLVEYSGGHPRELLRLLKLCCELAEEQIIDEATVRAAIDQLAAEYRYFLQPDDYALLVRIDADPLHEGTDERTNKLLYDLALLQYNDGSWRRSHPVVRTLEGYIRAAQAASAQTGISLT
ncbi:hypothetical protein B0G57_101722 [Trinickia symbiotica]|uniref:ATP-binding protein n=1 Tax=Trinickia symbiotica TaxID=863227 RepID=A0A2N7X1Q7_9BURK|nr:ATP-binding protein [Trinickia symbiotica]PMS35676.1 ATP-binding protein [Trinickia symbiotica]PPK47752.1 hypothetical protein B0G57_101722 [Trinickia symbiotica]